MKKYYCTPQKYDYLDHLVVKTQAGDAEARGTLYRDLHPVVEGWIERRFKEEDLRQQAYVYVWMQKIPKIIRTFRCRSVGLRFYSFLSFCVLRSLEDVGKTERRRAGIEVHPDDIEWACGCVDNRTPLDRLLAKESLERVCLYASDHLGFADKMILGRLLNRDMSQEQLAKRLGMTKSCVSKREARIRRELSAHLEGQESE
jgi:RNA polymerase sigma factor (sigma-70 family)